jgi:hypothetical protein
MRGSLDDEGGSSRADRVLLVLMVSSGLVLPAVVFILLGWLLSAWLGL